MINIEKSILEEREHDQRNYRGIVLWRIQGKLCDKMQIIAMFLVIDAILVVQAGPGPGAGACPYLDQ